MTPQYKITAHQAVAPYKGSGNENKFVPDLVSETVDTYIDLMPDFHITRNINFMERLWAYLSMKHLLKKVERGELYSCHQPTRSERSSDELASC